MGLLKWLFMTAALGFVLMLIGAGLVDNQPRPPPDPSYTLHDVAGAYSTGRGGDRLEIRVDEYGVGTYTLKDRGGRTIENTCRTDGTMLRSDYTKGMPWPLVFWIRDNGNTLNCGENDVYLRGDWHREGIQSQETAP